MTVVLIGAATILTMGCSSFHALFRSVETPIRKKQSEIDAIILADAQEAYRVGNLAQADELYREYVERGYRSRDKDAQAFAYVQLGRIAHEKSDFKAGNRYFEKAVELDPENLDTRGMYAESLYWQKDYNRAEALIKQAMQAAPNDPRFQVMLGRTLAQQKQYQHGQRYLKLALGEQGAYEELARIYHDHREYEMAALAATKSRESLKRQVAAASDPQNLQPNTPMQVTQAPGSQAPGAMPTPSYQVRQMASPQSVPQPPSQAAVMHPVVLPQHPALQQQVSVQYIPSQQNQVQQYPPPFQPQQQPQQQVMMMSANQGHPQSPVQNVPAQNFVPMVPTAAQPAPSPVPHSPQQTPESLPQWQPDHRPPYGFAATGQPANPQMTGIQSAPEPQWPIAQEIAFHPNYAAPQPGMSSPAMPSPINPLADYPVPAWQTPIQPQVNHAMPFPEYH